MSDLPTDENPYWHSVGQTHSIDLDTVRRTCFEIYNIFAASGFLGMEFEVEDGDDGPTYPSLLNLHHELAEPRAMELLLRLAMLVRSYDDILSQSDCTAAYKVHAEATTGEDYIGTLDTGKFVLREACNKIIHAREVRPIYDDAQREDESGNISKVWHLTGEIELAGRLKGGEWNAVLYVPPFLEIVLDRISFGWGDENGAPDVEAITDAN